VAWYGLSRTYAAKNDLINALEAIEKAIEIDPQNQWYQVFQANLFEKNGRNKDALATYENLVKRFPDTPEFLEKLAYLAVINEEPKRGLKALDKLEQMIGINEQLIANKHLIYVGMGDNKKAAEEYKKLANAYPNNVRYWHQLADFYERIGDKDNAAKTWQESAKRFPNDPITKLAVAGNSGGSDLQYLNSIKPLFSDAKVSIDTKVKELLPYLEKLTKSKDPAFTQSMIDLGTILEKTHPEEAKAWSISGDMYYLLERKNDALEKYMRCISLNANVFSVWDNALDILLSQNEFEDAEHVSGQAIDAFPNQPKAYIYNAVAANALRHFDAALNQLDQALLMVGNNAGLKAEVLNQSGDAWMGKGDKTKAKELWNKAYELSKNPDIQQKINRAQ
jgi:tetratricopeptide (TPR) repeat protein